MRPGAGRPLIPALLCTLAGPGTRETGPWRTACAGGETESPLIRDSPLCQRSGGGRALDKTGAGGGQCALCGVWSAKGSLSGTGGGVGGHSTQLKGGSTFPVAARQVPRPCGRNLHCLCVVRAERGVGDGARSVDGVGGLSVRGGLRGALQARGKSLAFVLCYGMRSVGSLGSVFHCQRSTLVSLCVSHLPGCPGGGQRPVQRQLQVPR